MKLPDCKIEKAICTDESRYSITSALLEVEADGKGKLIAANEHIMAIVPVEVEDGDTTGLISKDALETAGKQKSAVYRRVMANDSLKIVTGAGVLESKRPEGQFPNYREIVKGAPERIASERPTISFNVQSLLKLAQALGPVTSKVADVNLWIDKKRHGAAIIVRNTGNPNAYGVLMPIRD